MPDSALSPPSFSSSMLAAMARWIDAMRSARGCFFTFHRGAPAAMWPTLPNRNFYLDLDFLDALLSYLAASRRKVVTIEEGLKLARDPLTRNSFVNFSIDDCYRDTYETVVPLFRRHGVPITLFVTTGIPDGTLPMWWIGLEETIQQRDYIIVDGSRVATETAQRKVSVFEDLQNSWSGREANTRYETFCHENDVDVAAVHRRHAITWDMLSELAKDPLVEIGSHTLSHPRVSGLSPEDARRELAESRTRLREKLGVPVAHFAFPYGRVNDCGPRDFEIARMSGYESVATTTKGVLKAGDVPYAYPRVTLNGAHRNLLIPELHIAGASAAAARMLGRV